MITKKLVRTIREIAKATEGHTYFANYYSEYSDGTLVFTGNKNIKINQTKIRLKNVHDSKWEENRSSSPGWFNCEAPDAVISYNVYCGCTNSEPVSFNEWFENQEKFKIDFNDVPGFRG